MSLNILVPTDFSATADKAFLYALNLVSRSGGAIYLYHVYDPIENPFIETVQSRGDFNLENERELMRSLHNLRAKWEKDFAGVKVVTVLGRSPMVGSILKFTADKQIDIIVMGTQGATGLRKVLVGTMASRMLERATVPVLFIPEKFEWTRPVKIIMATNFYDSDVTALKMASGIARIFEADIEIVHIADLSVGDNNSKVDLKDYVSGLQEKIPGIKVTSDIIEAESVPDALETLHQRKPYDILVMSRHQRKFFEQIFSGSQTKNMACLTTFPLLVIPVGK